MDEGGAVIAHYRLANRVTQCHSTNLRAASCHPPDGSRTEDSPLEGPKTRGRPS